MKHLTVDSISNMINMIDEDEETSNKLYYLRQTNVFYGSLDMRMHIHFIRNYLDPDFADRLFEGLKRVKYNSDEESMVKIMGKTMMIPRKQVAFGDPGTDYHFSGTSVRAYDWNSEDSSLNSRVARELKQVSKKAGRTACSTFNHTLVNNYLDQTNCIGYHSDGEKDLGRYPLVAGISFGQEREIYFKSNITGEVVKISLPHNSFYVMHYPTNRFWKHSIPRSTKRMGQRISLTFRSVG
jgi:alkylated DNA repair dioxygenase AlkB